LDLLISPIHVIAMVHYKYFSTRLIFRNFMLQIPSKILSTRINSQNSKVYQTAWLCAIANSYWSKEYNLINNLEIMV